MIRYSLVCGEQHGFEAWFRDSLAFDDLDREGHLSCPQCGSSQVRKALMAPSIRRRGKDAVQAEASVGAEREPAPSVPAVVESVLPIEDDKARQMRAWLREMHARVKAQAENVGSSFPEEARKIHEKEEPARSIYGTGTNDEVRSLIEDGIAIMPLPPLPDERN